MNILVKDGHESARNETKKYSDDNDLLREFLNLYWLRPETAILNSLLAKNVAIDESWQENIDLSCGDGLFTFTLLGGRLSQNFNLYSSTKIKSSIVESEDIYDNFEESYSPTIIKAPRYSIRAGLDANKNMLSRAQKIGIYKELILAQAETYGDEVQRLEKFYKSVSIFASIFMYRDVKKLLSSIKRMLCVDGRLVVNVKTTHFNKFYEELERHYPPKFANYIERNMRSAYCNLNSESEWEKYFGEAGFSVVSKKVVMNSSMVPIWAIGLRSITPLLTRLVNLIPQDQTERVKCDFVNTFHAVFSELYQTGDEIRSDQEPATLTYVLECK